jgi:polyvinyl alcohol dehydrogenase (cytochrome)
MWRYFLGLFVIVGLDAFAQKSSALLYEKQCAICHNGAIKEAPSRAALSKLSAEIIFKTMDSGIMKAQSQMLTGNQKKDLADFLSEIKPSKTEIELGLCADKFTPTKLGKLKIANWGMSLENTRYSNENVKINAENASKLSLDWAFAFPDANCARVQPTIAGNTLFTASQQGKIYALDSRTGCVKWTYQAENEVRSALILGQKMQGLVQYLYFSDFKANVYAFDIVQNKLLWKIRADEHPNATITGSIAVYNGTLYVPVSSTEVLSAHNDTYPCCTFRGSVLALDAKTGKTKWKTYTVEKPLAVSKNKNDVQNYGPSGAPVWCTPTIDTKRGLLYVGTGENYSIPATATSDAILAMDLQTGNIRWKRQTVQQDAWNAGCVKKPLGANCPENFGPDYDFGAAPVLFKGKQDIILAGQKSGIVLCLSPDDGTIIWQKQIGRGGMMGGVHWGMATDGKVLFVPINDNNAYAKDSLKPNQGGLHAIDIQNGNTLWKHLEPKKCETEKIECAVGYSGAISAVPGLVFCTSLDGRLLIFNAETGKKIREFETNIAFETVNGIAGHGGTIDSAGPVVVEDRVFVNSGYAKFGELPGNVLLCFKLK